MSTPNALGPIVVLVEESARDFGIGSSTGVSQLQKEAAAK